ncbi:hypothetical protein CBP52_12185 [Cellulomonas sp. PSBB021]|nr:hypothetical protein CBP52_12185 [Cellulomonas sp. PSBB021]
MHRIRETYESLDRWRERSKTVEEPQPGSELHGDAAIWPGYPAHQVARVSLIAGVQHLNLARVAIEQREGFPIAHPTVIRGALLGASRGVWLLSPDDRHERQQHALRTIYEVHRRMRQYMDSGATGLEPDAVAQALSELDSRLDAIKALWTATPTLTAKEKPEEGKIVRLAALAVFADPKQQIALPALWMQLSGDAHGLSWPMLTRSSTSVQSVGRLPDYPAPMATFSSGADLFEIAEGFSAAFTLLRRGWSLFDQRCTAP